MREGLDLDGDMHIQEPPSKGKKRRRDNSNGEKSDEGSNNEGDIEATASIFAMARKCLFGGASNVV